MHPGSRGSQLIAFYAHTPANIEEILKQASSSKAFLKQRSNRPPSPSHETLNELSKGYQFMVQTGILLEQENKDIRAANATHRQTLPLANR